MARPFLTLAAAAFAALVSAAPTFAQTQVRVGVIPVLGVAPIFVVDKEGFRLQVHHLRVRPGDDPGAGLGHP